jgi:hypothetical protein
LLVDEDQLDACFKECRTAIREKAVLSVIGGETEGTVERALKTLTIRQWTTQQGGASTCGFEETLKSLADLPQDEILSSWTLMASDRFFVLFSLKGTGKLVGCIRVIKRSEAEQEARRTLFKKLKGQD